MASKVNRNVPNLDVGGKAKGGNRLTVGGILEEASQECNEVDHERIR